MKRACLGAVAAGLSALPAAASCVAGGEFRVSEFEVLSCQPASPRLEESLAKEAPELEDKSESEEPSAAELRQYLEYRGVQLRKEVITVVLLEVRPIRDRVYPRDPRQDPSASWYLGAPARARRLVV